MTCSPKKGMSIITMKRVVPAIMTMDITITMGMAAHVIIIVKNKDQA
ncbi:hypothetical protein [Sphaerochaeta sp.]|nr:hypothetical protein [Sphaerochaeta sp.]MDX9984704.1 hypothetical protein [Sphaerochaeta sp.]